MSGGECGFGVLYIRLTKPQIRVRLLRRQLRVRVEQLGNRFAALDILAFDRINLFDDSFRQ